MACQSRDPAASNDGEACFVDVERGEPAGRSNAGGHAGRYLDRKVGGDPLAGTSPTGEGDEVLATTSAPIGAEAGGSPSRSGRGLLTPAEAAEARRRRTMTAGAILLALGLLFLAANLGLFRWFNWGLYWPLLLVALGALLIWNRTRSGA